MTPNELENRLINFASLIIKVANNLPNTIAGNVLANQLIRSGTSPALNYGESRAAESTNDFIHKLKIVLKELRESIVNLKIIEKTNIHSNNNLVSSVINENNELISIFVSTLKTAQSRKNQKSEI